MKQGYDDFQKINTILVNEYNLTCHILEIQKIEIEEVESTLIESVFNQFKEDFKINCNYQKEEMKIYPYSDWRVFSR